MAHHHHHHHHVSAGDERRLLGGLALIGTFMVGELVAGLLSGSLALLADAAHMLGDVAALAVSVGATRLARRPARGAMTFGFGRIEIISAQANGLLLGVLGILIAGEAIARLVSPGHPDGTTMLAVAAAGIVVNLAAVRVMSGGGPRSLNLEGSLQHVLTDLYGFIGTAAAGAAVLLWGFARADPIASLIVSALMLQASGGLLRASGRIFMEAAPAGLDPDAIGLVLAGQPGVIEVHDLHVWEVTSGFPALSAHVVVAPDADCHSRRRELGRLLEDRFAIHHTTLQVEHGGRAQPPLQIANRLATLREEDRS